MSKMNLDCTLVEKMLKEFESGKNYICFGAGNRFKEYMNKYVNISSPNIKKPKYVCDNNEAFWGKNICGIEVCSPEKLLLEEPEDIIIIASGGAPYSVIDNLFSTELQGHYYATVPLEMLTTYFYYKKNYDMIEAVYNFMDDKKSKVDFEKYFQLSLDGAFSYLPVYTPNAYWNNDLVEKLEDGMNVLYAGAFDGKHIDRALKNNCNIIFHGFEPNKPMYLNLIEKYKDKTNVKLYPYALSDNQEVFDFDPTFSLGAKVIKKDDLKEVLLIENLVKVESNTVDDTVGVPLDLIALDIEGAEVEALKGARNMIKEHKPVLGICVYHKIEHYVEVPMTIKEINPDYKLYFRHHSVASTESVVYAK